MLERASVTEQFSTFIELADERFSRWVPDGRLVRSMAAACLGEQNRQASEKADKAAELNQFWAVYWYRCWGNDVAEKNACLPYGHLAAFVQEACYWAAQKTTRFSNSRYTLVDYFQLAIARLDTVLKYFSPEHGSRLDTYAHVAFKNIIRETLRQQKEIDICSDWALLLRLSQKRLVESLQAAGERELQSQTLAWRCFKAVYNPSVHSTRQLDQADAGIWSKIACEYNQQRQTLSPVLPSSDASTLCKTLRRCAAAARTYLYPKATSLNASRSAQDEGELQDILASPEDDSPLNAMVIAEELAKRRQQQADVGQVLQEALSQLPDEAQKIFILYYRENQTQQQIAQTLDIKQYTVSRRLSKAREKMLKKVAIWSRDTLHISLTSDLLTSINTVLEEWLTRHYSATGHEDF
ncbi:sigma-70 family RNA polymerase sigma factor [Leptolyngbya cf. ectocarpi LEGE 11479]|uniref:Sigma-70 family RNA polymerase sigma factor n=1 Tax=Leptolyngbya cf. ectocarpi LEGE 11479 TaxID=1828722 RepID=A0A928ZX46_LEPEC|nr:sigma-70 family RNA polymerase sigma factor [Leptolyngbya ectocarpi]MBE9069061.1 sigma-70 family RNA polymerase sigma factor [Leptolyngbya cf. ectocarpi LEGE 11479]